MADKYFIIDFDSTFVSVESFDELAEVVLHNRPDADSVLRGFKSITTKAMEGIIPISESLSSRLKLLSANRQDIHVLVEYLKTKITTSVRRNKRFFQQSADKIYIVSNGFTDFIAPVVADYGIAVEHVFANQFVYDEHDIIIGLDETNPLAKNQGKPKVVQQLELQGDIAVIGDGFTDYEIKQYIPTATFYAFTENIARENAVTHADFVVPSFDEFLYINNLPMAISYPRNRIKILLLENIHPVAFELLKQDGYALEMHAGSLSEDELCNKIKDVAVLGVRSKTMLTPRVLKHANKLLAVGAFCIGTNQIDLDAATDLGICVFNAPYSNTRSVVELVIGEIIMLLRHVVAKSNALHAGRWDKTSMNSFEVRGKKLGIIGYGNIGAQLSVLAESLGMQVYYYDLVEKLQLGNARKCNSLAELLTSVDIVTIHVDGRDSNVQLIGEAEFALMKEHVIFLNLSRGHVVDVDALSANLANGKILGAAVDVFPYEPQHNQEEFISKLRGFKNIILTPHIGGSTEEAQHNIGEFVAKRISSFINTGDSVQSVNLPNIQLPELKNAHRIIHLHKNVPGILAQLNQIFAQTGINILGQYLKTNERVGYVITDIENNYPHDVIEQLKQIPHTIKLRVLY